MNSRVALLIIISISLSFGVYSQSKKKTDIKNFTESFISDNFSLNTPSKWKPGDVFIYTDSVLNITIDSDSSIDRTINFKGQEFVFKNFAERTDWLGNTSMFLIFENMGTEYFFNTKKNLSQISDTLYNPLIPSFISKNEFSKANSLLKDQELYILTSEWQGGEYGDKTYKYVKVIIDYIAFGDNNNPYKIYFTYNNKPFYCFINLSNSLFGTSRYHFGNIFSFQDPKDNYKEIDQEVWEAIIESKVKKGMTHNEVRLSIGKPSEIIRRPTYSGLREIWVYGSGQKIVFFDGRVE